MISRCARVTVEARLNSELLFYNGKVCMVHYFSEHQIILNRQSTYVQLMLLYMQKEFHNMYVRCSPKREVNN